MDLKDRLNRLKQRGTKDRSFASSVPVAGCREQFPGLPRDAKQQQIIIGLDFGTAFTKVVISNGSQHYAVKWHLDGQRNPFLLPGRFYEAPDGTCSLSDNGGRPISDMKLRLLDGSHGANTQEDTILFLALAFQGVRSFVFNDLKEIFAGKKINWFINVGLPTDGFHDEQLSELYRNLIVKAWSLGLVEVISRGKLATLVPKSAETSFSYDAICVFPEFVAQITGYVRSPQRQPDLHLLIDVGAGTLDVTSFNVTKNDNLEDKFPIFDRRIEKLGTRYLQRRRLVGVQTTDTLELDPFHAVPTFARMCELTNITKGELKLRDNAFAKDVATVIRSLLMYTKQTRYPTSEKWKVGLPVFLCGGGGKCDFYAELIADGTQFSNCPFQIKSLPRPENFIAEGLLPDHFDRLSVAYGLSYDAFDLGEIKKQNEVSDFHETGAASSPQLCPKCHGAGFCPKCGSSGWVYT
ncbi:hypothetical protein GCM10017044_03090 [Kordiimonas sediminis]|uniref:Hsp70 family protein n=1 Tax=Kordiimonas sediminis TaxID=1735581 RepID=A0A919E4E8_9PROT|nr:hypothetical protein [Kordiimonas sediminis]GHF12515.1 hypothetical protein GCM10017044_03090 [Kordiimonas sediminis]